MVSEISIDHYYYDIAKASGAGIFSHKYKDEIFKYRKNKSFEDVKIVFNTVLETDLEAENPYSVIISRIAMNLEDVIEINKDAYDKLVGIPEVIYSSYKK